MKNRECRGIVLDTKKNFSVVAMAYEKFFNLHEKYFDPSNFNWSDFRVYEKLDGSICTLYYYGNEWHIASSSTPNSSGTLSGQTTQSQLFWQIWKELNYKLPSDTNLCYTFELMSKDHVIIIVPEKNGISKFFFFFFCFYFLLF